MNTATASTTVRDAQQGTMVVEIAGEMTSACGQALMSASAHADQPGIRRMVLDFSALEYMSSGGIGTLVALLVRENRQGRELAARGLSGYYREIFALTRLDQAITITDDRPVPLAPAATG